MNQATSSLSDDDSDLSESEDYLTHEANVDREALVRKKLLENFYGTNAEHYPESSHHSTSNSSEDHDLDDLDSSHFQAREHAAQHGRSTLHTLLERHESLQLATRTLDSTLQTLVYENYTRFIDATDAISSIGSNVDAHKDGLAKLTESASRLGERHARLEAASGALRDRVAEQIRVQRLLSRLDTILKLPQTLQGHIDQKQYLMATRAYENARLVIANQADSFESLQRIQRSCQELLDQLQTDLVTKLETWSGRSYDESVELPSNLEEIVESAVALKELSADEEEHDWQEMAVHAATRHLDRMLDAHLLDVQEQRYETLPVPSDGVQLNAALESMLQTPLIPTHVLDSIVHGSSLLERNQLPTEEFVQQSWTALLQYVQLVLAEETTSNNQAKVQEALHEWESVVEAANLGIIYIQQARELTARLIRQGVQVQFQELRLNVTKNVLSTLDERLAGSELLPTLQSTLNDCLQLVDDTIRSLTTNSSSRSAVEESVRQFIAWLANALQITIGGGVTAELLQVDPIVVKEDKENTEEGEELESDTPRVCESWLAAGSNDEEMVEILLKVHEKMDPGNDVMLAMVQLFLYGEKTLHNELQASITAHLGGKKKSRGLFPQEEGESSVGQCFHLAASQVLMLYATNEGFSMGQLLTLSRKDATMPTGPTPDIVKVLEVLKATSLQCCSLFGGTAKAGVVPEVPATLPSRDVATGARKTGLELDIERMFLEKIAHIYPHPSTNMEPNGILYLVCKVAFRSWLEAARVTEYSRESFAQLQIDIQLLRHMLPHYIDVNLVLEGHNVCSALQNLLDEMEAAAAERCLENDIAEELQMESHQCVRTFMEKGDHSFVIVG